MTSKPAHDAPKSDLPAGLAAPARRALNPLQAQDRRGDPARAARAPVVPSPEIEVFPVAYPAVPVAGVP